jgi:hypothetical protein
MGYYNTDENELPVQGTGHKDNKTSFEKWREKRDAKEAAAGWSRARIKASAITEAHEIKNRQKLKR